MGLQVTKFSASLYFRMQASDCPWKKIRDLLHELNEFFMNVSVPSEASFSYMEYMSWWP
jgi:hypothetical protein